MGERRGALGQFQLSTIANVDQTPLPFSFNAGHGYSQTGAREVWHQGAASGLEKCQCTVQLTLFADGEPQIKPLLIFHGKGKRLPCDERQQYDHRVVVTFQTNAWCDEDVMLWWIDNLWKHPICPEAQHPKLLILDVHKGQTTASVNQSFRGCKTTTVLVPTGCASLVQPLNVSFNAEFKTVISQHQNEHIHSNLQCYINNSLSTSTRRVLITKCMGWSSLGRSEPEGGDG